MLLIHYLRSRGFENIEGIETDIIRAELDGKAVVASFDNEGRLSNLQGENLSL